MDGEEEEELPDIDLTIIQDVDSDTATVIEMAAHMLDNDGAAAYIRATQVPLAAIPSTMAMAASMIATLAENIAELRETSADRVLLELRNWMDHHGEEDG